MSVLEPSRHACRDPEREEAENTEAAVDRAPPKWNAADRAADERSRNDESARDHPGTKQPEIAHGIDPGAEHENGDYEMAKREPIGAVRYERIGLVGVLEPLVDARYPGGDENRKA